LEQDTKKKFLIDVLFIAVVIFLCFLGGKLLFKYMFPFIPAVFIAWLVQKPAEFISRKTRIKKEISALLMALLSYAFFAVIIFAALYSAIVGSKEILKYFSRFSGELSLFFERAKNGLLSVFNNASPELIEKIEEMIFNVFKNAQNSLSRLLSSLATTTAKSVVNIAFNSLISLVACCYIAKDFTKLIKFLKGILSEKICANIVKIKEILTDSVFKIIRGYLLLLAITFAELSLGYMLLRVRFSLLLAAATALVDLLPVLGTGTVLIPWSVLEFVFGNSTRAILVLLLYFIVTVVRNFLEPKIIGKKMGINPLFVLFAMFLGIKFFGFIGVIILPLILIVTIKFYTEEI